MRLERVVGEGHPRPRLAGQVAEDHPLHDHRGAPLLGDADVLAVEPSLRRVPRFEHLEHAGDELRERLVDEEHALLAGAALVGQGELAHLVGAEVELLLHPVAPLVLGHDRVEEVAVDAVGHRPGLQQPAVGVPGGPFEARPSRQRLRELVVEADVDERGHEARHGDGRARADRQQQRPHRVAQPYADLPLELRQGAADARDGVVVERPVRHGRQGAEELGGEHEPLRHVVAVGRHLLQAEALEPERHLVVGGGLGLVDERHEPLWVVVHHAGQGAAVEPAAQHRDLVQRRADVAVERLQPQRRDQHLAQDHLGDRVDRHAARLALPGVVDEHRVQHLLVTQDRRGRELADAVDEELEHVLVLAEAEPVAGEGRLEHAEVGVEVAGIDAVDGQRALEAPDGARLAAQGVAVHVRLDAFFDEVLEQPPHELLDAERQPEGVELGLGVVAVDRGDARGDVALLVDVLGGLRAPRAQDDGPELLEHGEAGVEQAVAARRRGARLPGGEGAPEALARLGLEPEMPVDRVADVVDRKRVLVGHELVGPHEERDPAPVGLGERTGAVALGGRRLQRGKLGLELRRRQRQQPVEEALDLRRRRRLVPTALAGLCGATTAASAPRHLAGRLTCCQPLLQGE